ncbi:juvenile hormone esterase [Anabrus simplex]|uniref:juvenile hormone esterase n=1 Tax=Anabrus simplex TaxID=316456 RepID=UPI0035A325AA
MRTINTLVFSLLVLAAYQLGEAVSDDEFPIVNVLQGPLKGRKVTPEGLAPYYSFEGIPYAKPPLGELRFKAPVPAEPWNGTLEALQKGNVCKQPVGSGKDLRGDEDCLFLNVYTPELPGSGSLRPVMVWIHGGGFLTGSGGEEKEGPKYLLNTGIVYVGLNYRLGILGFLSTEDEAAPGNAGLKDQVLALRWVKQNIESFGGDPNKITIFGESAGGASVHFHLLSPMSEGLFHGAISQSGLTSCTWAVGDKPRKNAFLVGKALGFTGEYSRDLVDFLRNADCDELFTTSLETINEEDKYRLVSLYHEQPVVEPVVEGETAFLLEHPHTLLEAGKFQKVPYIAGLNSAEGIATVSAGIFGEGWTLQDVDQNFPEVFKPELRYCKEEACGDSMVAKIRSFYIGDKHLSNDTMENLVELCTDIFFGDPVLYTVNKMSSQSSAPVFFYQFSYDGGLAFGKLTNPDMISWPGVAHTDELGYIFDIGVKVPDDSLDAKVRSRMITMWTNFAKTGNPTPEGTVEFPTWLPVKSGEDNYYDIGSQMESKKHFHKRRMDFWKELYGNISK